ncbi:MAG: 2OG-Fe(II) oxygenase family protein [Pseudomonadota bacterium]
MLSSVPLIDFSAYDPDNSQIMAGLAAAVDHALSTSGFMAVQNIGISRSELQQVFADSRAFFNADDSTKRRSAYQSAAENFGYQGMAEESLDPSAPADLKETFTMRNVLARAPDDSRWPSTDFQARMRRFYANCLDAAFRLQRVLATALKLPADFFVDCHSGENVTLRLLHYPSVRKKDVADRQLGAGAHTDYGLLTLLFQDGTRGLEIKAADETWQALDADPNTILINSGDLLERWTNGRYRSTLHRVAPQVECAERQSIAMFVDPDSATEVAVLASCLGPDESPRYPPTSAAEHLQARIEATHKAMAQ